MAILVTLLLCSSLFTFHDKVLARPQQEVAKGYFVISNTVKGENRDIRLLLNIEFFTQERLRNLLKELFEMYPEPDRLDVSLYSDLEQVRHFVDGKPYHPIEQIRDSQDPSRLNRYASGLLIRRGGNEIIRYYIPDGGGFNLKTIVMKGRDPAYSSNK
jgi:hypothetical protein